MVVHLGPGIERTKGKQTSDKIDGSRSKAGQALIQHIMQYQSKGFSITRVTTDDEPSIKSFKSQIEALGVGVNILGHGSHAPHAESAIRHVKNKARSTLHSLRYILPRKFSAALIAFVVHTMNMVPKLNSPGHLSAHTAFLGRIPNFTRDAPHPFGTSGFLQRANNPQYNAASPRGDYCIWIGTTHNLAETHRCFNLDTLREITGDTFRPTPITPAAITRLSTLAGATLQAVPDTQPQEPLIENPSPPYPLPPDRGVHTDVLEEAQDFSSDIMSADELANDLDPGDNILTPPSDIVEDNSEINALAQDYQSTSDIDSQAANETDSLDDGLASSEELDHSYSLQERVRSQAAELVNIRNANRYELRPSIREKHVFSTLSIKAARRVYGKELSDKATRDELMTCIEKDVWECLDATYITMNAIPSKMFLTPKTHPNGELDRVKGRIVAGGHRQDRSLYEGKEISSPTVELTSVLTIAALAAKEGRHVMTLDHKAAYLNASMEGPPVEMLISPEVVEILCDIDNSYRKYVRTDKKIAVRLKKALYGCVQSAIMVQ